MQYFFNTFSFLGFKIHMNYIIAHEKYLSLFSKYLQEIKK